MECSRTSFTTDESFSVEVVEKVVAEAVAADIVLESI
jgi:hypothetical protein